MKEDQMLSKFVSSFDRLNKKHDRFDLRLEKRQSQARKRARKEEYNKLINKCEKLFA